MFLFFIFDGLLKKIVVFLTGLVLMMLVLYLHPDRGHKSFFYITPIIILLLCTARFFILIFSKVEFSNFINTGNYIRNSHKFGKWYVLIIFSIFPLIILLTALIQISNYIQNFDNYHLQFSIFTLSALFLFGLDTALAYRINEWLIKRTTKTQRQHIITVTVTETIESRSP